MFENCKHKFKPWSRYRYLPGQIDKCNNDIDLKVYNTHRYRVSIWCPNLTLNVLRWKSFKVFSAKAVVDTKPFKLDPTKWINRKRLRHELFHAIEVDRENKELLKRINLINRKGVDFESFLTLVLIQMIL